jgi:hypothetical protein
MKNQFLYTENDLKQFIAKKIKKEMTLTHPKLKNSLIIYGNTSNFKKLWQNLEKRL